MHEQSVVSGFVHVCVRCRGAAATISQFSQSQERMNEYKDKEVKSGHWPIYFGRCSEQKLESMNLQDIHVCTKVKCMDFFFRTLCEHYLRIPFSRKTIKIANVNFRGGF